MFRIMLFFLTVIISGVAIAENDEEQNTPVSASAERSAIPDSLANIYPKILHPDFFSKKYNEHFAIPSVPVDPDIDAAMPKVLPDPQVDSKIRHVYPHVGMGLVRPVPLTEPDNFYKYFKPLPDEQ